VRFVTERDPAGRFAFAPLQSELGRRLLRQAGLPEDTLDTVVLLQDGRAYLRSDAMLRAMKRLRAPWPLASLALVVPRFLRDAVYDFVARHRYRWFGRKDACPVPTPEQRARFLA
jgi:predicted DCC family thiol-disulfide oxidoreductase YuxK